MNTGNCMDCGIENAEELGLTMFGIEWRLINPDIGGILCANCTVKRARKLPHLINVFGTTAFAEDYDKQFVHHKETCHPYKLRSLCTYCNKEENMKKFKVLLHKNGNERERLEFYPAYIVLYAEDAVTAEWYMNKFLYPTMGVVEEIIEGKSGVDSSPQAPSMNRLIYNLVEGIEISLPDAIKGNLSALSQIHQKCQEIKNLVHKKDE